VNQNNIARIVLFCNCSCYSPAFQVCHSTNEGNHGQARIYGSVCGEARCHWIAATLAGSPHRTRRQRVASVPAEAANVGVGVSAHARTIAIDGAASGADQEQLGLPLPRRQGAD
jgi:hypothetical protein